MVISTLNFKLDLLGLVSREVQLKILGVEGLNGLYRPFMSGWLG